MAVSSIFKVPKVYGHGSFVNLLNPKGYGYMSKRSQTDSPSIYFSRFISSGGNTNFWRMPHFLSYLLEYSLSLCFMTHFNYAMLKWRRWREGHIPSIRVWSFIYREKIHVLIRLLEYTMSYLEFKRKKRKFLFLL